MLARLLPLPVRRPPLRSLPGRGGGVRAGGSCGVLPASAVVVSVGAMGCGGGVGATGVVEGGGGVIAPAVWRAPAASWVVVSAVVRDERPARPTTSTSPAVIVPRRTNAANTHRPARRARFAGGTVVTLGAPVGVASGGGAKVGTVGGSHGTGVGGVITGARVSSGGHAVGG